MIFFYTWGKIAFPYYCIRFLKKGSALPPWTISFYITLKYINSRNMDGKGKPGGYQPGRGARKLFRARRLHQRAQRPGKGSTFRIFLPLAPKAAEAESAISALPILGGSETILLFEDDEFVRELTKTIQENHGYRVIVAVDRQDGIERFSLHEREIDLLVLDVIMPRKSGKEVYQAVKSVRPDMNILFISGYPADMIDRKGILDDKSQLILKPVSPLELLRKTREILDRKG